MKSPLPPSRSKKEKKAKVKACKHESSGMVDLAIHLDGKGPCNKCKKCGEWY